MSSLEVSSHVLALAAPFDWENLTFAHSAHVWQCVPDPGLPSDFAQPVTVIFLSPTVRHQHPNGG